MSRVAGVLKWTLGIAIPALAFVVVSSAVVYGWEDYVLATVLGALAFPGIAVVWHGIGELLRRRRRRRLPQARPILTASDRWFLRSWTIAALAIGPVAFVLWGDLERVVRDHYRWPVDALRGNEPRANPGAGARGVPAKVRELIALVPDDGPVGVVIFDGSRVTDRAFFDLAVRAVPWRPHLGYGDLDDAEGTFYFEAESADDRPRDEDIDAEMFCRPASADERSLREGEFELSGYRRTRTRIGDIVCDWTDPWDTEVRARLGARGRVNAALTDALRRASSDAFLVIAAASVDHQLMRDWVVSVWIERRHIVLDISLTAASVDAVPTMLEALRGQGTSVWPGVGNSLEFEIDGARATARVELDEADLEALAEAGDQMWEDLGVP